MVFLTGKSREVPGGSGRFDFLSQEGVLLKNLGVFKFKGLDPGRFREIPGGSGRSKNGQKLVKKWSKNGPAKKRARSKKGD